MVLFDGPRSAEPPSSHGMFCARTFNTLPDASRPANPSGPTGKIGVPADRQSALLHLVDVASHFGEACTILGEAPGPRRASGCAALPYAGGKVFVNAVGN